MLRVSRLKGCNGHVWAKVERRVRASGVVLDRCWSRMIALRILPWWKFLLRGGWAIARGLGGPGSGGCVARLGGHCKVVD
jgi:hypothetical protein